MTGLVRMRASENRYDVVSVWVYADGRRVGGVRAAPATAKECRGDVEELRRRGFAGPTYIVMRSLLDESYRGSGLGKQMYARLFEVLARKHGTVFVAPEMCWIGTGTSSDAARVWRSLAQKYPSSGMVLAVSSTPVDNPVRISEGEADFCEDVAAAYDRAPLIEPEEIWRWELLLKSVRKMFRQISKQVDIRFVDGQPYSSAEQMRDDVHRTGVLEISRDFNEHPYFSPDDNLKFRAVHDYVVHIAPGPRGPDFTRRGEIRAYNLHRRLAPREAWPALFTEVLAQACYANARGNFPVQKLAVLDEFDFYNVGFRSVDAARMRRRGRQLADVIR